MFRFSLDISNPFHKNCCENITSYILKTWKITKNKSFEFQICKAGSAQNLLSLELDTRITARDHAGISFYIDLCSYTLILTLYDKRHWDFEHGNWYE